MRRLRPGWHLVDVVMTVPFVVIGQLDVWRPFGDNGPTAALAGPRPAEAVLMLIATSVLLWRRRWPLAVLAVMAAASLVQILALSPTAEYTATRAGSSPA
jgi:hypothetical protein